MGSIQRFGRFLLFGVFVSTLGCSSGGGGSPSAPAGPTGGSGGDGTLTVLLTDSPFSEASAVLVTFSAVEVHHSGAGWIPLTGPGFTRTCNLKKLTGATDVLGTAFVTGGHYTMIRLVISGATLYTGGAWPTTTCASSISPLSAPTSSSEVDIPSGEVKLNREFDLASGGTKTILLDFDGDKSIRERGNGTLFMQPVIAVLNVS